MSHGTSAVREREVTGALMLDQDDTTSVVSGEPKDSE